jgi:mannose-binding lectin 2
MQSRWWDFGGDTIIRTDKYVRLASDKASRDGWIFSRVPLTATNWEVHDVHQHPAFTSSRD